MNVYESPFNSRYASAEMQELFSPDRKFKTWRLLWVALAKAQQALGLNITDEQIAELEAHKDDIDYAAVAEREKAVRHDVMAHIYAYGLVCPKAKPIIHLGATSCYVGDNADLMIMCWALELIRKKLVTVIAKLRGFAMEYKDLPTLGFTHFQPAQLTTVGKRACLWLHDLLLDLENLEHTRKNIKLLGSKGTTGTQASFMELFENDGEKVTRLDKMIASSLGFEVYPVSGQTYSRKIDSQVMSVLCGIAESAAKFSNDIRLLQHLKEIEEPFEKEQVGSSAMAYKRNPMRSERIAGLARYVISNSVNTSLTAAAQWLERTLDDSSNKRIALPEAFLAVDAILNIYMNVAGGLVVYPEVIKKHIADELPFMATENIIMDAVKRGGDRQVLHEQIRTHSMAASHRVKALGLDNDLIARIAADETFAMDESRLQNILQAEKYTGRAAQQTYEFITGEVDAVLSNYKNEIAGEVELFV